MFVTRLFACAAFVVALASAADAQTQRPSTCMAVAHSLPQATYVAAPLHEAATGDTVRLTYAGHSTYLIDTPAGIRIATDFSGAYGASPIPNVVTMNKAHTTHFTLSPPPGIDHILPGWDDNGGGISHSLLVDDVYVRNVTTDISRYGVFEADANSIFIFEVAGLCIGHLGHLHHRLTDTHYAEIGRLDIVMVPVDGGMTLALDGMSEITRRLSSSIILPMHRHRTPMSAFISRMGEGFDIEFRDGNSLEVSLSNLPRRPTIIILAGV